MANNDISETTVKTKDVVKVLHETLSMGYANQIKIFTQLGSEETQKIIEKMNKEIGVAFFEAMEAVTEE